MAEMIPVIATKSNSKNDANIKCLDATPFLFPKIVMIRPNLRVLEQKVNASDPPSPRLRRARQTERCGQVRPATVYHALLRIAHHVQHPVQKQGRPVSNQRSRQADRLNELERTTYFVRRTRRYT